MKKGSLLIFVLLVTRCVPISTYNSNSITAKSYFNYTHGSIKSFPNQQLIDVNLLEYVSSQSSKRVYSGRDDQNIVPYSPFNYQYILDTLILRWQIWNPSINYNLRISDLFDKQYAKLAVNIPAILIATDFFEIQSSSSENILLVINFDRTINNNDLANNRTIVLRPEEALKRSSIIKKISSLKSTQKKALSLASLGYYLDALTLIELDLKKQESPDLVAVYWNIAKEMLINSPPNLNR